MRIALALLLVLLLTAGAYLVPGPRGFVFDDDAVVVRNEHLRQGLSREGVAWAFGDFALANWYPLTWVSHLAAYRAFGLDPAGHHRVNLALHLANTSLLALALLRMTGAPGPSLFTAALFALHPVHVETAAWVTERCGLLSGFFGLLALNAYLGYARRPGGVRALAVFLSFAAGLLSKAALVTLPAVFLLLDFWPLGRWRTPAAAAGGGHPRGRAALRLAAEKAPLLALAAAVAVVTYVAQQQAGAVGTLRAVPLGLRLQGAAVAGLGYLGMIFWPRDLAVYYPQPGSWPAARVALSVLGPLAVTGWCLRRLRAAPWLAVGWLWYLAALLPVIGLVRTGRHFMADRYTYLPATGIFLAVAWGAPAAARRFPASRPLLSAAAVGAVAAAALLTAGQLRFWRDEATLFGRAAAVTRGNFMASYRLGHVAATAGRRGEAIARYEEAVRFDPAMVPALYDLGVLLALEGRLTEAEARYRAALGIDPGHPKARGNLGELLYRRGRFAEAARELRAALRLAPGDGLAQYNLGLVLERLGDPAGALAAYRECSRLLPGYRAARVRASALGSIISPPVTPTTREGSE